MEKLEMLYEGKAKQVFATDNPDQVIVRFKDDATAFNAQKKRFCRPERRNEQRNHYAYL